MRPANTALQKTPDRDFPNFEPPSEAQLLADLEWLLLSPGLLAPFEGQASSQEFSTSQGLEIKHWLESLRSRERSLCAADFELKTYQRLGRYAEKLLSFFVKEFRSANRPSSSLSMSVASSYKVSAQNLALRSSSPTRQTLGEIDYLLLDPQGHALHWELAVKFFLCEEQAARQNPDIVTLDEFLGPNRQETLSLKHAKLFDQQLRHQVPAPFDTRYWKPEAYTRGWMFYKLGEPRPSAIGRGGLSFLNPAHGHGFWLYADEIDQLQSRFPRADFYSLEKGEWLSQKNLTTLQSNRKLLLNSASFESLSTPLMLSVMEANVERARGFIRPSKIRTTQVDL